MPRRRPVAFERLELRATPAVFVEIPDTLTAQPGGEIVAPINIDNVAGVRGAEIRLRYDTALLDATNAGVQAGPVWPATGTEVVANVDDAAGTITVFVFGPESLPAGTGALLDVRFVVASTATSGSTRLDLEVVRLNEGALVPDPEPQLGDDPTDGLITVITAGVTGRISGTVFADTNRNSQPDGFEGVPAVTVTLIHLTTGETRSMTTGDDGRYEFTNLAAGEYEIHEQQPVALIDGGPNRLVVTLAAGQTLAEQDFRELGLRAEFIFNRLQTTTVLPVGSPAWHATMGEIVVAAPSTTTDLAAPSSVGTGQLPEPPAARLAAPPEPVAEGEPELSPIATTNWSEFVLVPPAFATSSLDAARIELGGRPAPLPSISSPSHGATSDSTERMAPTEPRVSFDEVASIEPIDHVLADDLWLESEIFRTAVGSGQ